MTTRNAQQAAADSAAQQFSAKQSPKPYPSDMATAPSPPSKRDLTTWWKQFKRNGKKEDEKNGVTKGGIFGVPLNVSIKYANVAISLNNENGESFIYGYVPIVVAKCGVFLKEQATDVEGIFRLSGSARRIKELQEIFDSPERYGKGLDWAGYTVHDAANILRRYLNQLPEPIVPLDFYERFREPLRNYEKQALEGTQDASNNFNYDGAVSTYQQLIRELPPLNKQLLLYILDLLAVFASKSEKNRMTSANLAAIFQPGLLSHPSHDMAPEEYKLSQDVLIFLIENQDHFLFGMNGTAADPQIVKEFQSNAAAAAAASSLSNRTGLRRSASNASAGADSLRKYENLRRNVSVSSKHSRRSSANHSPGTPPAVGGGGVHRSNTVPSKKSPALSGPRGDRTRESPKTPTSTSLAPPNENSRQGTHNAAVRSPRLESVPDNSTLQEQTDASGVPSVVTPPALSTPTPTRERKRSSFFSKSPLLSPEPRETRPTNRLKKKRIPGSANASAQSSNQSLEATAGEVAAVTTSATFPTYPTSQPRDEAPPVSGSTGATSQGGHHHQPSESTLKANRSRSPSMRSRSSVTDHSDFDHLDDVPKGDGHHSTRNWRLSLPGKRHAEHSRSKSPKRSVEGQGGEVAAKESLPNDPQQQADVSSRNLSMTDSEPPVAKEAPKSPEPEKRSLFGKFRAKVAHMKEPSRDSDTDKDRAKSPLRSDTEASVASSQSWSHVPKNGKRLSSEHTRESIEATLEAPPSHPVTSAPPPVIPEEPGSPVATVKESKPAVEQQSSEEKPAETQPPEEAKVTEPVEEVASHAPAGVKTEEHAAERASNGAAETTAASTEGTDSQNPVTKSLQSSSGLK